MPESCGTWSVAGSFNSIALRTLALLLGWWLTAGENFHACAHADEASSDDDMNSNRCSNGSDCGPEQEQED